MPFIIPFKDSKQRPGPTFPFHRWGDWGQGDEIASSRCIFSRWQYPSLQVAIDCREFLWPLPFLLSGQEGFRLALSKLRIFLTCLWLSMIQNPKPHPFKVLPFSWSPHCWQMSFTYSSTRKIISVVDSYANSAWNLKWWFTKWLQEVISVTLFSKNTECW